MPIGRFAVISAMRARMSSPNCRMSAPGTIEIAKPNAGCPL
jgi:hypothetical protein